MKRPVILFVEEDARLARAVTRVLESRKWTVRHVPTVADGRKRYKRAIPDVLLLDSALPDANAWVLEVSIPRVAFTHDADQKTIRELHGCGVSQVHVKKQTTPRGLAEAVGALLEACRRT